MRKSIIVIMVFLFSIGLYANIKFIPNQIYIGQKVSFSSDNVKGCTSCSWDFGDGTIINGVADNITVEHVFTYPGNYTIIFKAGGCMETPPSPKILVITVLDNRIITINPQNPKVHTDIMIELKNAIKSPIQWNFGDGTNANGNEKIQHAYQNPGNYKITAIDSGAKNFPVYFNLHVSPDFRSVVCVPQTPRKNENITFTAQSFQSNSIKWDFGDGTIQLGSRKITHNYSAPGSYTVKIYDNGGKDDYPVSLKIYITDDMRTVIVNPISPKEGENISFTAKNFKSSNLLWDFGDGVKKKGSLRVNHFYRNRGIYEVKVYGNNGDDINPIKTKIRVLRDSRNVLWEPKKPYAKNPVMFRLISVSSNKFKWKFGDRTEKKAFGTTVYHTYNKEGVYTVKVFDMQEKFFTPIIAKISVLKDPRKVEANRRTVHVGEKDTFKAFNFKSSNLLWDFGDGTKKTGGSIVTHIYRKQGSYSIKVKDQSMQNNKDFSVGVTVLPDIRKLEIFPSDVKVGKEVEIRAVNFYSDKVFWDFGDGIKRIGSRRVKHIYRKTGRFRIKAIDYMGKDSKVFEINITVKIEPSQASALIISGGKLFFKNNYKNFLIVPKDYKGATVVTKLKYEGTGTLLAYWLIDGQKYKAVNENLSFGQNKEFVFKHIPTLLIGFHRVGFSIHSPKSKIELEGYYFVSAIDQKIKLLSPSDEFKTRDKTLVFQWSKLYLKNVVYILRLSSSIGKLFEKPEIKKITSGDKIKLNESRLVKGKWYYWIIEAKLKTGKTLAVSEIRKIKMID